MKRFFLIAFCLCVLQTYCSFAQNNIYDGVKIEEVKRAFLTQQLRLTPAEAQAFFPVYNQYMAALTLAWQQSNGNRIWFAEKSAEIKDNYRNSFIQILRSHERADNVFRSERSFRTMLQNEMLQRRQYPYRGRSFGGGIRGGVGRRR